MTMMLVWNIKDQEIVDENCFSFWDRLGICLGGV